MTMIILPCPPRQKKPSMEMNICPGYNDNENGFPTEEYFKGHCTWKWKRLRKNPPPLSNYHRAHDYDIGEIYTI